jgi:sugar phosphate isomerase/epimerase
MLSPVTVGAHPWVYAAKQPQYDISPILQTIFADVAYAGFDGVELMHNAFYGDDAVDRIGELSARHGLSVIGSSWGGAMWNQQHHEAVLADARRVIPRLAAVGGRTLGVSVGHAPQKKTPEQLDAQADCLRQVLAICGEHGVTANLHNHTYEVVDDLHDLRGTLDRVGEVKLGPDLNWLVRGGVDPAWFLREFREQVVFLHLRDQRADGRWSESLGEGDSDFAAVRAALEEIDFVGDVVIELAHEADFEPTRSIRESLRMSREFVREALGC